MAIEYQKLPVYEQKERILEALKTNQVIVVQSPTGSGKTTQLPIILHEAGYDTAGMIAVTQPRRIAALSVSEFISRQLGTTYPGLVGYKMRFEDKTDETTKISPVSSKDFSFWSAHAANTSSITVFVSLLIREKKMTISMILWCLLNCYTRLYLGMHYPTDIICGLLAGIIIGGVVYYLYEKVYYHVTPKINYISSHFTSTGFAISDIDVVFTMMVFILIYSFIKAVIICL